MYDSKSNQLNIDQARLELFTKKGGGMEQIPSTKDALVQSCQITFIYKTL